MLTTPLAAGKERNVPLQERSNKRIGYEDPVVCKYDLAGICPHGAPNGSAWKPVPPAAAASS